MAANSKIQWTDHTFNPWVGCTKVSPACDHCYAEGWAKRAGAPDLWAGKRRRTSLSNWHQPIKWNAAAEKSGVRARVFCASLADVFDNQVPTEWRDDLWALITKTPFLDWQLLTKRPQNIHKMLPQNWGQGWQNVWLGTTVENHVEANRRIPHLLAVPASIKFLSCEPLLDQVDLTRIVAPEFWGQNRESWTFSSLENGDNYTLFDKHASLSGDGPYRESAIDWVICGGESGSGFRQIDAAWARSLRDQCQAAGVAFFMKQMSGTVPSKMQPIPDDLMIREMPR